MTISSYEVEVKIAIDDPEEIAKKLIQMGATKTNSEIQIDTYFNHPCRDFAITDEALRLRSRKKPAVHNDYEQTPRNDFELTYKGPKVDETTKTRFELSVDIDTSESMKSILLKTGFIEVATVKKERTFYSHQETILSIDIVDEVGTFLEAEQVVTSEEHIPDSRERIFEILSTLGLERSESIRESYLELLLRKELS